MAAGLPVGAWVSRPTAGATTGTSWSAVVGRAAMTTELVRAMPWSANSSVRVMASSPVRLARFAARMEPLSEAESPPGSDP